MGLQLNLEQNLAIAYFNNAVEFIETSDHMDVKIQCGHIC